MMATLAKAGLQPVLHVLHLAQHEGRARRSTWSTSPAATCPRCFRPNFFTNTPDILHAYLQRGGRPAFEARLVLAATLSPSYGIYSGFENVENVAVAEGSEEYLDSEKYELKARRLDGPLLPLVARLNRVRREQPGAADASATQRCSTSATTQLFAVAKQDGGEHGDRRRQPRSAARARGLSSSFPGALGARRAPSPSATPSTDARYDWRSGANFVRLEPGVRQAHVLVVERVKRAVGGTADRGRRARARHLARPSRPPPRARRAPLRAARRRRARLPAGRRGASPSCPARGKPVELSAVDPAGLFEGVLPRRKLPLRLPARGALPGRDAADVRRPLRVSRRRSASSTST